MAQKINDFWNRHTVNNNIFKSVEEHKNYLKFRFDQFPLYKELMELYSEHSEDIVLEYGSGPGDDLVGFITQGNAKKVIGIDISQKAFDLTLKKIDLYNISSEKYELIKVDDSIPHIPLEDNSVDYIFSQGVIHHTSFPEKILSQLYRVLKPNKKAKIMVYNYDSAYVHQYVAFYKLIEQNKFQGKSFEEAFSKSTDTEDCPLSIYYKPNDFIQLCEKVGFKNVKFNGGYFNKDIEIDNFEEYNKKALNCDKLDEVHKKFLNQLDRRENDYLYYKNLPSGIGGVYSMEK